MLDDLVQTIETLQRRIREHREYLGNYESRTRVALIDPMLCALGWDVSDPDAVQTEPRTVNGWADYALLGSNRRPVIFVEAKKLADQDSPIRQTVGYAVSENIENRTNVRYCASTNGDVWEVYDITAQESVMRVSLTGEDAAKCALKLVGLWRRSLEDGRFDDAVEPLIEPADVAAPTPAPPAPTPAPPAPTPVWQESTPTVAPLSFPVETGWMPLNGDFTPAELHAPSATRFPDGERKIRESWPDVLEETAKWLIRSGILTRENCQFSMGPKRYLVNLDGMHKGGKPFVVPRQVGAGIVLEAHLDRKQAIRQALRLLNHFNQDPSQIYLKLP